jgi:hypothetical protein
MTTERANDVPQPTGDPLVWVAVRRRGVDYHALIDATTTRCGRSTRTGHVLPYTDALHQHQATPCRRCWAPTTAGDLTYDPSRDLYVDANGQEPADQRYRRLAKLVPNPRFRDLVLRE